MRLTPSLANMAARMPPWRRNSFQALGFYQKRGYTVAGQLDGYPPGHTKYFLRKELDGPVKPAPQGHVGIPYGGTG